MLGEYEHRDCERVQLAVLNLADGNMERLRYQIEDANCDYRDMLGPAEYPGYTKKMFSMGKLPEEECQRIIEADLKQYHDWHAR